MVHDALNDWKEEELNHKKKKIKVDFGVHVSMHAMIEN